MKNDVLVQLPSTETILDSLHERIVSVTDLIVEAVDMPIESANVEGGVVDGKMRLTITLDMDFEQWFQAAIHEGTVIVRN